MRNYMFSCYTVSFKLWTNGNINDIIKPFKDLLRYISTHGPTNVKHKTN